MVDTTLFFILLICIFVVLILLLIRKSNGGPRTLLSGSSNSTYEILAIVKASGLQTSYVLSCDDGEPFYFKPKKPYWAETLSGTLGAVGHSFRVEGEKLTQTGT